MHTHVEQSRLVSEESCLGYLYPKRIDTSKLEDSKLLGSRLGNVYHDQSETEQRNSNARVPKASNLESLLTYPKKIHSKSGALLGFGNLKYPVSMVEEALER